MFNKIYGQKELVTNIENLLREDKLPQTIIMSGDRKSGKTLFSEYIAYCIDIPYINISNIDEVRLMIEECYTSRFEKVYIIEDFNLLNFRAKEAMLKILEEPPQNSYIVLNTYNDSFLKDTIKNRCYIFNIDNYKLVDLQLYESAANKNNHTILEENGLYEVFNSIGWLMYINENNRLSDYLKFIGKFLRIINTTNGGDALKSLEYISVKKDDDKIDFLLFLKLLYIEIVKSMKIDKINLIPILDLITKTKNKLIINRYLSIDVVYSNFIIDYRYWSKKIGFTRIETQY